MSLAYTELVHRAAECHDKWTVLYELHTEKQLWNICWQYIILNIIIADNFCEYSEAWISHILNICNDLQCQKLNVCNQWIDVGTYSAHAEHMLIWTAVILMWIVNRCANKFLAISLLYTMHMSCICNTADDVIASLSHSKHSFWCSYDCIHHCLCLTYANLMHSEQSHHAEH